MVSEAQEELAVLLQEAMDKLRESRKQNAALVEQNKQLVEEVQNWHTNLVQTEAQNVTRASKRQRKNSCKLVHNYMCYVFMHLKSYN